MIQYSHFDSPVSPQSFLSVVHKRRKTILLLFVLIVASVVGASFILPPQYRSLAKVMVNYQNDSEKAHLLGLQSEGSRALYDKLGAEVVIFKTRSLLDPVVTQLGLDQPKNGKAPMNSSEAAELHDKAIEDLAKDLEIEREKDTNVLTLSYEHKNPRLAANVVDKLVTEYIKQRPSLDRDDRAYEFFDKQIQVIKNEIEAAERRGMEYKSGERVLQPDKQTEILFSSVADFDKELTRTRSERIAKEAKLQIIREQMANGGDIVIPTNESSESPSREEYLNELKKTLLSLELKKSSLAKRFTAKHPEMATVLADIEETKNKIRAEVDEVIQAEELSIKALMAAEQALAQRMNQVVNSVAKLSQQEFELNQLTIGIDDLRSVYSMLIRQREEARIASSKQEYLVQIRLLEPAMVPHKPSKPNRPLFAGLAVLLGLVVSFGFAFFLEYFDHSVNTVEDAQNCLGLPILAAIPDFEVAGFKQPHNGHAKGLAFDDFIPAEPSALVNQDENLQN